MDDLVERLRQRAIARLALKKPTSVDRADAALDHEAAAHIQDLETSLAEAEGRVIAEVVAWLRDSMAKASDDDEMQQAVCDVAGIIATALETGEWKK